MPLSKFRPFCVWLLTLAATIVVAGAAVSQPAAQRAGAAPPTDPNRKDWIQLFNGRDLDGWTPKFAKHDLGENFNDTFRVEDGLLEGPLRQVDGVRRRVRPHVLQGSVLVLPARRRVPLRRRAGARAGPAWAIRNNGLMLHSPHPKTMLKDQDFPISIEVQLLGGLGDGKPRTTANLCTPGTNVVMNGKLHTAHCINSTSKTYDGDQWVRVEVLVHGDELMRHIVDGQTVLEYTEAADRRRRRRAGRSGGQGRRHAADRRLHLDPGRDGADRLPQGRAAQPRRAAWIRRPTNYKAYFVKANPALCK